MQRVRVGTDGSVAVVSDELRQRLAQRPGEYALHAGPSGTWMLQAMGSAADAGGHVLMAGELVTRMTVVEIVNVVMSTNWRGELHIVTAGGRRILTMDQGALKHAQTEFNQERLGELLVRQGVLQREQLQRLLVEKAVDQRFGQLLVERQVVDQGELFNLLQKQTEAIFYASLLEEQGVYWFVTPSEGAPTPPATVHLPVQGLLMEGVQRIDEMALYREQIPDNRAYPQVKDGAQDKAEKRDSQMQLMFDACDGRRNLEELARVTGFGEFQTVKTVYHLLRGGHIVLLKGETVDPAAAREMVRHFNEIVRDIFVVVATYGSMQQGRQTLTTWLQTAPHGGVLGTTLDIDGTLSAEDILQQLTTSEHEHPLEQLHQALHELAAYALFTATTGLPRHEEQSLARDINHRLKGLRL